MSISKCLQIRIATSARSGCHLHSHHPLFSSNENLHLTTLHGFRASYSSFSFPYSPYTRSFYSVNLGSHVVCKAHETFDAVQAVTDCSWNQFVIANDNLVIVQFSGGSSPMIEPRLNELAKEYEGKVECYKMNTDDYPNISKQLGIESVPIVLFFKDGERKESIIGDVSKSALKATIKKYLDG